MYWWPNSLAIPVSIAKLPTGVLINRPQFSATISMKRHFDDSYNRSIQCTYPPQRCWPYCEGTFKRFAGACFTACVHPIRQYYDCSSALWAVGQNFCSSTIASFNVVIPLRESRKPVERDRVRRRIPGRVLPVGRSGIRRRRPLRAIHQGTE